METLREHNFSVIKPFYDSDKGANVLCDSCHVEMEYMNPGVLNMSNPPSRTVVCPKCGCIGYKIER